MFINYIKCMEGKSGREESEADKMDDKLKKLEEVFEMQEGTLRPDMRLDELEEWDSMTRLSLIVMMEDDYGKKVKRSEVMNYTTVQDIVDSME